MKDNPRNSPHAPASPSGETLREKAIRYFQGRMQPFTQEELAALLQVSRFALLRWRRAGKIRAFRAGGVLRYHVEDVYRMLMHETD